jgi:hypothetical protein
MPLLLPEVKMGTTIDAGITPACTRLFRQAITVKILDITEL